MKRRKLAIAMMLVVLAGPSWASGTMTVSQLGTYAVAATNAANSALASISNLPASKPPPKGLIEALQGASQAAQGLSGVTAGADQAQQFQAAVAQLMPLALPWLAALGPQGAVIAVGVAALSALVPVVLQAAKAPVPAAATLEQKPNLLPYITPEKAVELFGPKT